MQLIRRTVILRCLTKSNLLGEEVSTEANVQALPCPSMFVVLLLCVTLICLFEFCCYFVFLLFVFCFFMCCFVLFSVIFSTIYVLSRCPVCLIVVFVLVCASEFFTNVCFDVRMYAYVCHCCMFYMNVFIFFQSKKIFKEEQSASGANAHREAFLNSDVFDALCFPAFLGSERGVHGAPSAPAPARASERRRAEHGRHGSVGVDDLLFGPGRCGRCW